MRELHVRNIPDAHYERLAELARADERPITAIVRRAIRNLVETGITQGSPGTSGFPGSLDGT